MASIMDGWSDPRLTKTFLTPASHRDSKKANEAVYLRTGQRETISHTNLLTYTMVAILGLQC
jgi:hypothetical protein